MPALDLVQHLAYTRSPLGFSFISYISSVLFGFTQFLFLGASVYYLHRIELTAVFDVHSGHQQAIFAWPLFEVPEDRHA